MRVLYNGITLSLLTVGALVLGACGSKSGGGPGPTPVTQPPQITCPADITVKSVAGSSQAVSFPDPVVTGGATPVATSCNRASGSSFPLGITAVSCTATDTQQRAASCSFSVSLTGFALSVKKFETFGDSLTEGEVGRSNIIDTPNAYPTRLQQAMDATYPGQGLIVINRGEGGNFVEKTVAYIRQFVPADRPDAVLILSGYNNLNLNGACSPGNAGTPFCNQAVKDVEVGILDCIRKANEASGSVKYVFVSTLTPPGPSGSNRIDANAITQANGRIRQVAAAQRATLVDSYAAFLGHESEYVNVDGLHLRPAGYQALADAFFAAIKTVIPQTPLINGVR